jgi:hypothetical protein
MLISLVPIRPSQLMVALEKQVFSLDSPEIFYDLYNPQDEGLKAQHYDTISKKVR